MNAAKGTLPDAVSWAETCTATGDAARALREAVKRVEFYVGRKQRPPRQVVEEMNRAKAQFYQRLGSGRSTMGDLTAADLMRIRVKLDDMRGVDPIGLRHPARGELGIIVYADVTGSRIAGATCAPAVRVHPSAYVPVRAPDRFVWLLLPEVQLDLADAATRDRVARWVVEQAKPPRLISGATAPFFGWSTNHGVHQSRWRLLDEPIGWSLDWMPHNVPALADLDPHDNRLLPDGSRWVDAAALAEVARHVGSQHG